MHDGERLEKKEKEAREREQREQKERGNLETRTKVLLSREESTTEKKVV